jgi:hypothetical protein
MSDFLERNGHHEFDGAVDDVVDAVRASQAERGS